MAFELSRGNANIPAEVQRWQYFLRTQGIPQVGAIDADFGLNTENATKFFQVSNGLSPSGRVDEPTLVRAESAGYVIVDDSYYVARKGSDYPAPSKLSSPSNASRNRDFSCFRFLQLPRNARPDAEAIVQRGTCDGAISDWVASHIVTIDVPQLKHARGFGGKVRCHSKAAPKLLALFRQWERDGLLHLVLSYEGCFVPRYKRGQAPKGTGGHQERLSRDVGELSNHSFGSAFDINAADNGLGKRPALCGQRGSVRELVESATAVGIYWGGHFARPDGMHFEISTTGP